jgi:hypothetical protein
MKRTILFLVLGILVLNVQAKIWRVNNTSIISADYSNFQIALDNTPAGDTLYVEGSVTPYTNSTNTAFSINKKLTIVGPGYFLEKNDTTLYLKNSAELDLQLNILSGAAGTKIEGMKFNYNVFVGASNVTITRNWINYLYLATDGTNAIETTHTTVNGNFVTSSIFISQSNMQAKTSANSIISNNIVMGTIVGCGNNTFITNNTVKSEEARQFSFNGGSYNPTCNKCAIGVLNSVIQNNIGTVITFLDKSVSTGNTVLNNISYASTAFLGIGSDNIDRYYMTKPNGPAYKTGTNGDDCGAFGGSDPYVLSGLPAIPHIYDMIAPVSGSANSGLVVKLKVKTQN